MKKALRNSLIAAGLGLIGPGMMANAKGSGLKPEFSVCVHNYAGVPASTLRDAEKIAKAIFQRAGVESTWMDYVPSSPGAYLDETRKDSCASTIPQMIVNLVDHELDPNLSLPSNVLGVAPGDPQEPNRYIVFVFEQVADRLIQEQQIADKSEILGHAMAHELGHILAHVDKHSPAGLMRANWQDADFEAMTMGTLIFNSEQAARIREDVTRRTRERAMAELALNAH